MPKFMHFFRVSAFIFICFNLFAGAVRLSSEPHAKVAGVVMMFWMYLELTWFLTRAIVVGWRGKRGPVRLMHCQCGNTAAEVWDDEGYRILSSHRCDQCGTCLE